MDGCRPRYRCAHVGHGRLEPNRTNVLRRLPRGGRYEFWHSGPNEIVVRRASVIELDTELQINEQSGVIIEYIDGAPFPLGHDPFGRGERMLPHRRYYAFINVNRSLVVKYRAAGFLGHLSRATLRIDEGP